MANLARTMFILVMISWCCCEGQLLKRQCVCNLQYLPVCSKDGITFPNACSALCSKKLISCRRPCPCPDSPKTDESVSSLTRGHEENKVNCICPKIANAVCSEDGTEYMNRCFAKCKGAKIKCRTSCPCEEDEDEYLDDEDRNDDDDDDLVLAACTCEEDYRPVCGRDGETYTNECFAGCKEVSVRCDGRCPCDDSRR